MITSLILRTLVIFVPFIAGIFLSFSGYPISGMALHGVMIAYVLFGTLSPSSRLFGAVETGCEKGIWLTLDDGPDPTDTPAILDLLDRHHAKTTFFVIGKKAAKYPELIREIHRRGHQIGNHSWSHPHAFFWCLGPIRTYREIVRCQEIITSIIGEAPKVFRAPVGHYNIFVHPILKHFGLRLVGWSSRGFDGIDVSLTDVTKRIRKSARDGGIILAHETTPIAQEVVADILRFADENNWECVIPASPRSDNY